jgi:hypothetical protein
MGGWRSEEKGGLAGKWRIYEITEEIQLNSSFYSDNSKRRKTRAEMGG